MSKSIGEMSESELKDFIIELQEENMELEHIVGLRQKRGLISKFDKEYDEEDKKKNPNRDYAGIIPDAEEVYKRYYELKDNWKFLKEYVDSLWLDDKGIVTRLRERINLIESRNSLYKIEEENSRLERALDKRIDAWEEMKEYLEEKWEESQDIWYVKIINKMREIENGRSSRNI